MKVIFLDVDGVLSPMFSSYEPLSDNMDVSPSAMDSLKRIVDETNAEIVLSSSWRTYEDSRKEISRALAHYGLSYIDCTPDFQYETTRGEEISAWLSVQKDCHKICYVILDDFPVAQFAGHEQNLVNVDFKKGLTEEDADSAIKILND